MLKVGYIGLGLMGKSMARNILKAGFHLVVHNRSQSAVDELVAEGAKQADSPKDVAEQVDVVFTNLPDSPDVELVALGENGIIEGAHDGLIFVDNSTIKPVSARMIAEKLSEKNVFALDAPVSGGDIGAKNGTLTIMELSRTRNTSPDVDHLLHKSRVWFVCDHRTPVHNRLSCSIGCHDAELFGLDPDGHIDLGVSIPPSRVPLDDSVERHSWGHPGHHHSRRHDLCVY
jgi:prephenate dehydrogenase